MSSYNLHATYLYICIGRGTRGIQSRGESRAKGRGPAIPIGTVSSQSTMLQECIDLRGAKDESMTDRAKDSALTKNGKRQEAPPAEVLFSFKPLQ